MWTDRIEQGSAGLIVQKICCCWEVKRHELPSRQIRTDAMFLVAIAVVKRVAK